MEITGKLKLSLHLLAHTDLADHTPWITRRLRRNRDDLTPEKFMTGKVNTQHKQDFSSLIPKLKQQVESSWRTILTSFLQDAISECQSAERLTQVESVLSDLRFTQLWLKKNRTMVEMEVPAQLTHNLMSILTDQEQIPPALLATDLEKDKHQRLSQIFVEAHAHLNSRISLLNQFFSVVSGRTIEAHNSPIGPQSLTEQFFLLVAPTTLPDVARPIIYHVFERALNRNLREFYHQLIGLLLDEGIVIGSAPQGATGATYRSPELPFDAGLMPAKSSPEANRLAEERAQKISKDEFTKNQLDTAITDLMANSGQFATSTPLVDLVSRKLIALFPDQAGARLAAIHVRLIDVVDQLFRSVSSESSLLPGIRGWIAQLQISYLQIILDDPTFIDDRQNLARRVLNQLVELGAINAEMNPRLESGLNTLIARVQSDGTNRFDALVKLDVALNKILTTLRTAYENSVKKISNRHQNKDADVLARTSIRAVIAGKNIPKLMLALIDKFWHRNLVLLAVSEGEKSSHYHDNVQALIMLNIWLSLKIKGKMVPVANKSIVDLLAYMDQALSISFGNNQHRPLLKQIHQVFFQDAQDVLVPVPASWGEEAEPSPPEKKVFHQLKDSIDHERARKLKAGDWVHARLPDIQEKNLKLAWTNGTLFCFVFANSQGIKQINLELEDLSRHMALGVIDAIGDVHQPFVDRVLTQILSQDDKVTATEAAKDSLTGLVNRFEFEKRLHQAITSAREEDTEHVMCYLDIDQFKMINNTLGTDVGDNVLKRTAEVLSTIVPETGCLARLGGNEFGLLLEDCDFEVGQAFAERARRTVLSADFSDIGEQISLTLSIGLVQITQDSQSPSLVLQHSSTACDQAKKRGRNRVSLYAQNEFDKQLRNRVLNWISKIDKHLDQNWLYLKGQMIRAINPASTKLPHYEILLGINDDDGKPMSPVHFIEAAEKYNRMPKVDRWVVNTALKWMKDNPDALEQIDGLSINLSGQSFSDETFLDYLKVQIRNTSVPLEKICFEVTETAAVESLNDAIVFMQEIRDMGCRFSLDDFGTGMSSYSYLKELPFDYLKIDGVFIRDITTNQTNYGLVKSVNELAHLMGKQTIAEYVENEEILAVLAEIGVDNAQGWGIEKPQTLDELAVKLSNKTANSPEH